VELAGVVLVEDAVPDPRLERPLPGLAVDEPELDARAELLRLLLDDVLQERAGLGILADGAVDLADQRPRLRRDRLVLRSGPRGGARPGEIADGHLHAR